MNAWLEEQGWNERAAAYANRIDGLLHAPEQQHQWSRRLQSMLGEASGLKVLDIGTGSGFLAVPLTRLGHRVTGLDFSEKMVRIATEKTSSMGLDSVFVRGRAEKLPFADGEFDAIVSRHLLHYLSNRRLVLEEWLRVLKPGGRIAIWDGDWMARNIAPYALMQWTGEKRGPRRAGILKRQGKIRKADASGLMRDDVTADLLAAGFRDIQSHERQDEALSGLGKEARLACERLVIAARKP